MKNPEFIRRINGKNYIDKFHLMQVQSIVKYGNVKEKEKCGEDLRAIYDIDFSRKGLDVETGEILCLWFNPDE